MKYEHVPLTRRVIVSDDDGALLGYTCDACNGLIRDLLHGPIDADCCARHPWRPCLVCDRPANRFAEAMDRAITRSREDSTERS